MSIVIDDFLYSILKFTNTESSKEDIILEDCGECNDSLTGYSIVLSKDKIPAMQLFLCKTFESYKDLIVTCFEDLDIDRIIQCCYTYYPDKFTPRFLERFGGIDNLVKYGPYGDLSVIPDKDSLTYEEEEDEEMLKQEIERLRLELEEANSKLSKAEEELEYFKEKYEEEDIDNETLEFFMDVVEEVGMENVGEAIIGHILEEDEKEDRMEIARVVSILIEQFDKMELLEDE